MAKKEKQEIGRSNTVATTTSKQKRKHGHTNPIPSYFDDDVDLLLKKHRQVAAVSFEEEDDDDSDSEEEDEVEEESIHKLLEPLSKDQLTILLAEAASKHHDVANRIRSMAEVDPAHRKIFVHGLGWDSTTQTLIDAFIPYGEIEECKAVTDKLSGKSKGYGFVLFKTRAGALNALKEPHKMIGNRMTACQFASMGPVPQSQSQPSSNTNSNSNNNNNNSSQNSNTEYNQRKIFVSNVGPELDPKRLTEFFLRYGEIEEGPLGLDKVTGKPKGFCFFVYKNVESAKKALQDPHKNFEGYVLHCQKAIEGHKSKSLAQTQNKPQQHNVHSAQLKISENTGVVSSVGQPAGAGLVEYNQAQAAAAAAQAAAAQAFNPTFGPALAALLAVPGAGLGLTNLLGALGTAAAAAAVNINPGASASGTGIPVGYGGSQVTLNPAAGGTYGNQGGYQNQSQQSQTGQAAHGRDQIGAQFSGVGPYLGL